MMGCSAFSSMSAVQQAGQNGVYESVSSTSEGFPDFKSASLGAQSQENSEAAQQEQNTAQYAYDYDYAFASSDPGLSNADFPNSLFNNSAFNNPASNNVVYAYDFQSASS